ncbi:MAG: hypothetical protein ACRD59_19100, partial [Candidatus Acidiferrales bacterium]
IRSLKQRDLGAIFSATVSGVDPAALPPAPISSEGSPVESNGPPKNDLANAPAEAAAPKPAAKRRAR